MSVSKKMKVEETSEMMIRINRAYRDTAETRETLSGLRKKVRELDLRVPKVEHDSKFINTRDYPESDIERAIRILNDLRSWATSQTLTDVVLIVGGQRFPCHKLVLSHCSPYFKTMFETELDISKQKEIAITEVSKLAMSAIVDYAYGQKVKIEVDDVEEILAASHFFQVKEMQNKCENFMLPNVDDSNCVNVYKLASLYDLPDLKTQCFAIISRMFPELSKTSDFLEMNLNQLEEIIGSDDLYVLSEKQVLDVILKWAEHDIKNRRGSLPLILKSVRLSQLPPIEELKKIPLLAETEGCLTLIEEAIASSKSVMQQPSLTAEDGGAYSGTAASKPRKGFYQQEMLAYTTTYFQKSSDEERSKNKDKWLTGQTMVVTEEDEIFVVGGHCNNTRKDVDYNFRYQKSTNSWIKCAPLQEERSKCECVSLPGFIYAIGGSGGGRIEFKNSVERYNVSIDSWEYVNYHKFKSISGTCANNGSVYLINNNRENNRREVYFLKHPSTIWVRMYDLPYSPSSIISQSLTTFEGNLYYIAVGTDPSLLYCEWDNYMSFLEKGKLETLAFSNRGWKQLRSLPLPDINGYRERHESIFYNINPYIQEVVMYNGGLYLVQVKKGPVYHYQSILALYKYLADEERWVKEHELMISELGCDDTATNSRGELQLLFSKLIPLHEGMARTDIEDGGSSKVKNDESEG